MTTIAFGAAPLLFVLALILNQKATKIKETNAAASTSPWSELSIASAAAGVAAVLAGLLLALV
jgi:hypothetical protein